MIIGCPLTEVITEKHLDKYENLFILSISDPPNRP